jgi:predicted MFS family arabinose efflux permease
VAFPLVWIFLKDAPEKYGMKPEPGRAALADGQGAMPKSSIGLTTREAARTRPFWLLILAFVLVGVAIPGLLAHFVPLLVDRGITPAKATIAMSAFGVSVIFGRVLAGQLMDMFFAPRVAAAFLLGPALGLAILGLGASGNIVFLAAIFVGLAIGAEFDVITFLSSRYFGLKSAGTISGYTYSAFHVGAGLGPAIMGFAHDRTGEYTIALWILSAAAVISAVLIVRMGPYPNDLEKQQ